MVTGFIIEVYESEFLFKVIKWQGIKLILSYFLIFQKQMIHR